MFGFEALAVISSLLIPVIAQNSLTYMPFGDSITEITCWRALLWQKLQQNGYTNVDFVGSMTSQTDCQGIEYNRNHEGHSGYLAVDIAKNNRLTQWLSNNRADFLTMHLGTNDITHGHTTNEILAAFTTLVNQTRDINPNMRIIVAQITPLSIADKAVQSLNAAIPAWADALNTTTSPIWVVDQYTGFDLSDLSDGTHPNAAGDVKIANKFYPAILMAMENLRGVTSRGKKDDKRALNFVA